MIAIVALLPFVLGVWVLLHGEYRILGKQAIQGQNGQILGVIFMVPFIFYLMGFVAEILPSFLATGKITSSPITPPLTQLFNLCMYGTLIIVVSILGYTAFFAPDSTYVTGQITLPTTVNIQIAAAYLRITEEELLDLIQRGVLQARKIGDEYRIHKEVLIGYQETTQGQAQKNAP
jgi:excisionase family DNA binding protein